MTWRFRRSLTVVKGVRINFGKRGASLSLGGRGLSLNFGRRGTRATVGLPGSGLSYSTRLGKRSSGVKATLAKPRATAKPTSSGTASKGLERALKVAGEPGTRAELDNNGVLQIKGSDGKTMTEKQRTAFINGNRQQMTEWLRAQASSLESEIERARTPPDRPRESRSPRSSLIVAKPPVRFVHLLPERGAFAPLARLLGNGDTRRDRAGKSCRRIEDWRKAESERWYEGGASAAPSALSVPPLSESERLAVQTRVQARLDEWLRGNDVTAHVDLSAHETRPEAAIVLRVHLDGLHLLPQGCFEVDIEKPGVVAKPLSAADRNSVFRAWALRALATMLPAAFRTAPAVARMEVRVDATLASKKGDDVVNLLKGRISRDDYVVHFIGWDGDEIPHGGIGRSAPLVTCKMVPDAVSESS